MKRRTPWVWAALLSSACAQPGSTTAPTTAPEPPPRAVFEPTPSVDLTTWSIARSSAIEALAFTQTGDGLVVAAGSVELFALSTPSAPRQAYRPPADAVASKTPRSRLAVCRDDRRLFVAGADQPVRAYSLATGKLLRLYPTSALGGWRVRVGDDGGPLVMDGDGHLKRFTPQGQLRWCYPPCEEDDDWLEDFDLAADGKLAVVALNQGRVILVDTATGKAEKLLAGLVDPRLVRFVPGAVIVGTKAGALKRIETETRREAWSIALPGEPKVAAFAREGKRLVLGCGTGDVLEVRLGDGKIVKTLETGPSPVTALAIAPDGVRFAYGKARGVVKLAKTAP